MRLSELCGKRHLVIENKGYKELSALSAGAERCAPSKFCGPGIRDYYLIHFIAEGTGVFENPRGKQYVSAGQAFLIRPGETCKYTADENDPWVYMWLGFEGRLAERFDDMPDVFNIDAWITDELCRAADMETGAEEYLTGVLFKLYAEVFGGAKSHDRIKQITDFINVNYMRDIKVEDIADMLHMNRKYLARVFRERTGVSIKQYLIDKRLCEAKRFLAEGCSVGEAAAMAGYRDSFTFSKAFKKKYGASPIEYRK